MLIAAGLLAGPGGGSLRAEHVLYDADSRGRIIFLSVADGSISRPAGRLADRDAVARSGVTIAAAPAAEPQARGAWYEDHRSSLELHRPDVQAAEAFLKEHAWALGRGEREVGRPAGGGTKPRISLGLMPLRAERDALGMTHVRYQQQVGGVPVFGSEVIVHLGPDGRVRTAGGRIAPDVAVDTTPVITRDAAVSVALAEWQGRFGPAVAPDEVRAGLSVFVPGLVEHSDAPSAWLVWQVRLTCDCPVLADETTLVDARTGEVRQRLTGVRELDRWVWDCSLNPSSGKCYVNWFTTEFGGIYYFGRSEAEPVRGPNPIYGESDVDNLYDFLATVYDYVFLKFGRDGANDRGGTGNGQNVPWTQSKSFTYLDPLPSYLGYCPNAWSTNGNIRFCMGTVHNGLVGHEYCHGFTTYSHFDGLGVPIGMVYQGESGALDENQADIFGEMFEYYLTSSNDWIMWIKGPGDPAGAWRNLADPPAVAHPVRGPHPDRFHSDYVYCGSADNYGVHHNSTVPSKAAYLLAEGGSFNGCTIDLIGRDKIEQIWYRAVTEYYATTETFNGAYLDLIASCGDLYGAGSEECRQLTRALQAVEL
ncbi:MAG: M4 family metallopeptidase, partial [Phycisphaerae bacterium]|nr:M4 family metallopeptidase [Phycisphaerae bacterium]